MKVFSSNRSIIRLVIRRTLTCAVLASTVLAYTPMGHAQSREDKHTRKVHRKLEKYGSGSYLHIVLRNRTDEYGALGSLTDASFRFKSADTNDEATIAYADVDKIKTDREPIGEGSEHHYFRTRTYVIAGALVAGAAVAAVEVH